MRRIASGSAHSRFSPTSAKMMKTILVCLLVGLAAASTQYENYAWKKNTEYKYNVEGRTLTALHDVADQYAGVLVRARLVIRVKSNGMLSGRMESPEYAQIHANLPAGWASEIPQSQLHYKPLPLTNTPFEIELENGAVKQVFVDKDIPNWEANVIKALISQIQVDVQGQNLISSHYNQKPEQTENSASYKTMEDTVSGKCETFYNVFPLPEHVLQNRPQIAPLPHLKGDGQMIGIVKSKNYSRCDQEVNYHFGLPEMFSDVHANYGKFFSKSSMSLVVISGNLERHTIQSSVTTNKIIVSPTLYNSQKGMVVSRFNITLQSVNNAQDEPEALTNPKSVGNLVYAYNTPFGSDNKAHMGHKNSPRQEKSQYRENVYESNSSEERREREENRVQRHRRALNEHWKAESKSGEKYDDRTDEEAYQPMPTLNNAPQDPLLPYFIGNNGQSIRSAINPVQAVQKVAQHIAHGLQNPSKIPEDQILSRFTILTDLIRIMNVKELQEASRQLYAEKQSGTSESREATWKVYRDAMAQAGTGPALVVIKEWIQTMKVHGEEAAELLAVLSEVAHHPTLEYIRAFFDLARSQQVKQQRIVSEAAILSLSHFVRKAIVNHKSLQSRYPVDSYPTFASELEKYTFLTEEYIPYLSEKLDKAVREDDSKTAQVMIRALGNVAHAQVLAVFKPYLEGERQMSDFQRFLIVVSMDELSETYPEETRSVLYKIYANTGDSDEVRSAAVFQLMRTSPPADMLQRIAEYTAVEPSMHVRAAIKSAIESASKLENEEYQKLARNAQAAVKLLHPDTYGLQYDSEYLHSYIVKGMNLAYKHSAQMISGRDSMLPKYFRHSLRLIEGGVHNKRMQMSAMVSSIKDLFRVIREEVVPEQNSDEREDSQSYKSKWADKIAQLLNIQMNKHEKLEGNMHVFLFGGKRFVTFDNRTIEKLPTLLEDMASLLRSGKTFNLTKMYDDDELTIAFPTEMGFPFVYTLRKPTLVSISGQVQYKTDSEKWWSEKMRLQADLHVVLSTKTQGKIGFVTPFENQYYVSGYDKNAQLNLPIRAKVELDTKKNQLELEFEPLYPEENTQIVHFSSWPYTSKMNLLELRPTGGQADTHVIRKERRNNHQQVYGEEYTGFAWRIQYTNDREDVAYWIPEQIKKYDALTLPMSIWYDNSIFNSEINMDYVADKSTSRKVSLKMNYKEISEQHKSRNSDSEESKESNTDSYDAARLAETSQTDAQTRQKQILQKASAGIRSPRGVSFDASVEFFGRNENEQQHKYVANYAYAHSQIENKARRLLYIAKNNAQEQSQQYQICVAYTTKATQASTLNFIKALQAPSYLNTEMQVRYGQSCQQGAEINIKAKLEKSEERKQALQQSSMAQLCARQMKEKNFQLPACANLTVEASRMDRAYIEAQYKNVGHQFQNATIKMFNFAKYLGYQYLEANELNASGSGNDQQIIIRAEFEPTRFETVNVTVQTPKHDYQFKSVEINDLAKHVFAVRPESDPMQEVKAMLTRQVEAQSIAVIDNNAATTFNNRTFDIVLGHCYHVFVHTERQESYEQAKNQRQSRDNNEVYFTVLVRDAADTVAQKEVKVIFKVSENKHKEIDLYPSQSQGQHSRSNPAGIVKVDDKMVEISNNQPYVIYADKDSKFLGYIYVTQSGEVKVEIPERLTIHYDGARVKAYIADFYRNQVRGIAGTFNGESWSDFTSPKNCLLRDARDFVASYAVADETCQGPAKELYRRVKSAQCAFQQRSYTNVVSARDSHHHGMRSSDKTCSTKHQTRYVEHEDGTVCFTIRALPVCQKGCKATKLIEKSVDVYCLPKTSPVVLYMKNIDKGASPDFSGRKPTKSISIQLPHSCKN